MYIEISNCIHFLLEFMRFFNIKVGHDTGITTALPGLPTHTLNIMKKSAIIYNHCHSKRYPQIQGVLAQTLSQNFREKLNSKAWKDFMRDMCH